LGDSGETFAESFAGASLGRCGRVGVVLDVHPVELKIVMEQAKGNAAMKAL
jgi:hypothetical protein